MPAMTPEQLKGMIDEMVGKAVGSTLDERLTAFQAKQSQDMAALFTQKQSGEQPKAEKGIMTARCLMATAGAALQAKQGRYMSPSDFAAKVLGDEAVAKALSAGTGSEGGYLIPEILSSEVIELLRPASAVRRCNPVIAPMDSGNLTLPKLTGGPSASYIGENANLGKTQQVFGTVTARAKKLGALVPISNDLLRRRSPGADTIVRDDLVASLAQKSDEAFILFDGTGNKPKGLYEWSGGSSSALTAQGSPHLAKVTTDLGTMVLDLVTNNVRMLRPGWIFSPRTWNYLMTVRDGNGNYAFRDEMLRGTLWGWPFPSRTVIR